MDPNEVSLNFGIWSYMSWTVVSSIGGSVVFQGCWSYPDHVAIDSDWKAARAFSVMACIFGFAFLFSELFSACSYRGGRRVAPASGVGYLFCSLCTGLTLLLLGSDLCNENELTRELESVFPNIEMSVASCGISTGAKCAISAAVLWFVAGAASIQALRVESADLKEEERAAVGDVTSPLVNDVEN